MMIQEKDLSQEATEQTTEKPSILNGEENVTARRFDGGQ